MIGIYCITNLQNGKRYIGQSGDILKRWKSHISDLKNGSHRNRLLQNDFYETGVENFSFNILEELPDRILINEKEQYWINKLKTYLEYNIQVSLSEENKNDVGYIPVEALNDINISLRRKTPCGYVNYITYEILLGILDEYYIHRNLKIEVSMNKIMKMRNLQRGRSTFESTEKYFRELSNLIINGNNPVDTLEYNSHYTNGNFILLKNDIVRKFTFMPYNRNIFNNLSSALAKHLYLIIEFNRLKTNSNTICISKQLIPLFDDEKFAYNKKIKNAFSELRDKDIIKEFKIDNNFYKIK